MFFNNLSFYARLGPNITYPGPNTAVLDVFWRSGPPAGPQDHCLGPSGQSGLSETRTFLWSGSSGTVASKTRVAGSCSLYLLAVGEAPAPRQDATRTAQLAQGLPACQGLSNIVSFISSWLPARFQHC